MHAQCLCQAADEIDEANLWDEAASAPAAERPDTLNPKHRAPSAVAGGGSGKLPRHPSHDSNSADSTDEWSTARWDGAAKRLTGLDWTGLDWTGLDGTGRDGTGRDGTGRLRLVSFRHVWALDSCRGQWRSDDERG